MSIFDKLFRRKKSNYGYENTDAASFIRSLSQDQQSIITYQANFIKETILDYMQENGIESISVPYACVFVNKGREIGSCGVVGNPTLVRKTNLGGLVYFSSLQSFRKFDQNPDTMDAAIEAMAIEATIYLLSGNIDPPKDGEDDILDIS